MKLFLEAILGLAFVHGVLANAPKILWADCPDDSSCNRCLDIAFESENDIACLHQKYPENGCVFEGALMNSGSVIAVSSQECFTDDTLENIQVAFMDSRCPGMTMFEANAVSGISTAEFVGFGDGEAVDEYKDPIVDSSDRSSKNEGSDRQTQPFPANGFKLNVAVRYDTLFAQRFFNPFSTVANIQGIMALVQPMYFWNSLDANMCINVTSILPYDGPLTTNDLDNLVDHVSNDEPEDANVFVFITHLLPPSGGGSFTVGIAWRGSLCYNNADNVNGGSNNGKGFRVSINSWVSSDLGLSKTIAHEIGHNLNMRHDFDGSPGNVRTCTTDGSVCTYDGGVMDYFQPVTNKWTCCSNADFKELHDQNQPFCLEPCFENPPTTTTPAPPGGCQNADEAGDGLCDDGNNNAECNFDDGDCCPPHDLYPLEEPWDTYCQICECLEPETPPTTGPTTTIAPPGGCENSKWAGDQFCDDGNNNAECNFDDGDCCPPYGYNMTGPFDGGLQDWDNFCEICECLEPVLPICGGQVFGPSGTIQSPLYPEMYPPNTTCRWNIMCPEVVADGGKIPVSVTWSGPAPNPPVTTTVTYEWGGIAWNHTNGNACDRMLVVEPYPNGNCTNGIPHMPTGFLTFDPQEKAIKVTLIAAMFYSGHPFQIDFTCEPCKDQKSFKFCKKQKKKGKCSKSKVWKKCKKTCDKC